MTITLAQQTRILQTTQAMFGAAPGAVYLQAMADVIAENPSFADLAQTLAGKLAFFGKAYSASLDSSLFASAFVDDLVGNRVSTADKAWANAYIVDRMAAGATREDIVAQLTQALSAASADNPGWGAAATFYNNSIATKLIDNLVGDAVAPAAKAEVVAYIVGQMAAGQSFGQMVQLAITALDGVDHANATWGAGASRFDNRSEVARYYSVDKAGDATDLGTLQQALAGVSSSAASVVAAKAGQDTAQGARAMDNGYLAGATVLVDSNGDGMHSAGELVVTTDSQGRFTLPGGTYGPLLVSGGTDISTHLAFEGTLSASAGSAMLTPLTALMQAMVDAGDTLSQAQTSVLSALGLAASIDLQHSDGNAIALGSGSTVAKTSAVQLQAAAAQVSNIVTLGAAAIQGASSTTSAAEARQLMQVALANHLADASGAIDLTQLDFLKSVITEATAGCSPTAIAAVQAALERVATLISASVAEIDDAVDANPGNFIAALSQIARVEVVVQGAMANAVESGMISGSLAFAVGHFTGSALDAAVAAAVAGNLTASVAATPAPDTTPPAFAGATVDGGTLVISYSEATTLDAAHPAAPGAFTVLAGGVANAVTAVAVDAAAKTVTLTLSSAVADGAAVTVGYTDPSVGNDANATQDAAGNDALTISARTVTNNTSSSPPVADTTAPVFASAAVNGGTLVLSYTEASTLDAVNKAGTGAFAVDVNAGTPNAVTAVTVNAGAKTVTLTLTTPVLDGDVVTVAYTDPTAGNDANATQDAAGNDAMTIAAQAVSNNTVAGAVFTLTTFADSFVGAGGDDIFNATIDQATAANGSFNDNVLDTLAGGLGIDTLNVTPIVDVALTSGGAQFSDTLFTNITGIEKLVINTTVSGIQTLTTGALFNTAFNAAGVDLSTTSSTGTITIDMATTDFTGAAILRTTSTTGIQTITAGSGLTTVIANSDTGAHYFSGAGLTDVTSVTTSGVQTITTGAGVAVATVSATSSSGSVTVTTDSGADVVTLETGAGAINTINTNGGKDVITLVDSTVASTSNMITAGSGADTISLVMGASGAADTIVIGNTDSGITLITADSITGFATGIDFLAMGTVGDSTPASGNYIEAAGIAANFAAALIAANIDLASLAGTSGATELYAFQWDAGNGYLFNDIDGNGSADQVVVLVGITDTMIASGDIVS